eukprot:364998-Chlamydomonas_euryale.AAC.5
MCEAPAQTLHELGHTPNPPPHTHTPCARVPQNLDWLLYLGVWSPGRLSSSEAAYEAYHAAVGLLSVWHCHILDEAGAGEQGQGQPRPAHGLYLDLLEQVETLVELRAVWGCGPVGAVGVRGRGRTSSAGCVDVGILQGILCDDKGTDACTVLPTGWRLGKSNAHSQRSPSSLDVDAPPPLAANCPSSLATYRPPLLAASASPTDRCECIPHRSLRVHPPPIASSAPPTDRCECIPHRSLRVHPPPIAASAPLTARCVCASTDRCECASPVCCVCGPPPRPNHCLLPRLFR